MSALLVSTLQSVATSPTKDHSNSHAIFTGKQESRIEDHIDYKVKSICNGSEEWLIVSNRTYLNPCHFVDENQALTVKIPGIHFRPRMEDVKISVWSSPSAIPSLLCHLPSGNGSSPGQSNYFSEALVSLEEQWQNFPAKQKQNAWAVCQRTDHDKLEDGLCCQEVKVISLQLHLSTLFRKDS